MTTKRGKQAKRIALALMTGVMTGAYAGGSYVQAVEVSGNDVGGGLEYVKVITNPSNEFGYATAGTVYSKFESLKGFVATDTDNTLDAQYRRESQVAAGLQNQGNNALLALEAKKNNVLNGYVVSKNNGKVYLLAHTGDNTLHGINMTPEDSSSEISAYNGKQAFLVSESVLETVALQGNNTIDGDLAVINGSTAVTVAKKDNDFTKGFIVKDNSKHLVAAEDGNNTFHGVYGEGNDKEINPTVDIITGEKNDKSYLKKQQTLTERITISGNTNTFNKGNAVLENGKLNIGNIATENTNAETIDAAIYLSDHSTASVDAKDKTVVNGAVAVHKSSQLKMYADGTNTLAEAVSAADEGKIAMESAQGNTMQGPVAVTKKSEISMSTNSTGAYQPVDSTRHGLSEEALKDVVADNVVTGTLNLGADSDEDGGTFTMNAHGKGNNVIKNTVNLHKNSTLKMTDTVLGDGNTGKNSIEKDVVAGEGSKIFMTANNEASNELGANVTLHGATLTMDNKDAQGDNVVNGTVTVDKQGEFKMMQDGVGKNILKKTATISDGSSMTVEGNDNTFEGTLTATGANSAITVKGATTITASDAVKATNGGTVTVESADKSEIAGHITADKGIVKLEVGNGTKVTGNIQADHAGTVDLKVIGKNPDAATLAITGNTDAMNDGKVDLHLTKNTTLAGVLNNHANDGEAANPAVKKGVINLTLDGYNMFTNPSPVMAEAREKARVAAEAAVATEGTANGAVNVVPGAPADSNNAPENEVAHPVKDGISGATWIANPAAYQAFVDAQKGMKAANQEATAENSAPVLAAAPVDRAKNSIDSLAGMGLIQGMGADIVVGKLTNPAAEAGKTPLASRIGFVTPIKSGATNYGTITIKEADKPANNPGQKAWEDAEAFNKNLSPEDIKAGKAKVVEDELGTNFTDSPRVTIVATDYMEAIADAKAGKELPVIFGKETPRTAIDKYVDYQGNVEESLLKNPLVVKRLGDEWKIVLNKQAEASKLGKMVTNIAPLTTYGMAASNMITDTYNERMGSAMYDANRQSEPWARVYQNELEQGGDFHAKVSGMQVGYREVRETERGQYIHSVALQRDAHRIDFPMLGGTGQIHSTFINYYYTDIKKSGHYVDVSAKLGHAHSSYDVMGEKSMVHGSFGNTIAATGVEYGARYNVGTRGYIEPQAQVQYTYVSGTGYKAGAGHMHISGVHSLIGRAGMNLGVQVSDKTNVYTRASIWHEYLAKQTVTAKDYATEFENVMRNRATWYTLGLGVSHQLPGSTRTFIDVERVFGNDYKQSYRVNAGAQFKF